MFTRKWNVFEHHRIELPISSCCFFFIFFRHVQLNAGFLVSTLRVYTDVAAIYVLLFPVNVNIEHFSGIPNRYSVRDYYVTVPHTGWILNMISFFKENLIQRSFRSNVIALNENGKL